jgi:predicted ArsR family transcriptional regulator
MVQLAQKGFVILQHEDGKRGRDTARYSLTHKAQDILDDIFK